MGPANLVHCPLPVISLYFSGLLSLVPFPQEILGKRFIGPKLPLPRGWKRRVGSSVLHILALSHYTFPVALVRAANSKNRQVRLQAQSNRGTMRSLFSRTNFV